MDEISMAMASMQLQQQVQLSVVSKAMDVQTQNADALIEAMNELPMAQDPTRGTLFDHSV